MQAVLCQLVLAIQAILQGALKVWNIDFSKYDFKQHQVPYLRTKRKNQRDDTDDTETNQNLLLPVPAEENEPPENIPWMPDEELCDKEVGKCMMIFLRRGLSKTPDDISLLHHWALGFYFKDKRAKPWIILEGRHEKGGDLISCYGEYSEEEFEKTGFKWRGKNESKSKWFHCPALDDLGFWQSVVGFVCITTWIKAAIIRMTPLMETELRISPLQLHRLAAGIPDANYIAGANDCQTWVLKTFYSLFAIKRGLKIFGEVSSRNHVREPTHYYRCLLLNICEVSLLQFVSVLVQLIHVGFKLVPFLCHIVMYYLGRSVPLEDGEIFLPMPNAVPCSMEEFEFYDGVNSVEVKKIFNASDYNDGTQANQSWLNIVFLRKFESLVVFKAWRFILVAVLEYNKLKRSLCSTIETLYPDQTLAPTAIKAVTNVSLILLIQLALTIKFATKHVFLCAIFSLAVPEWFKYPPPEFTWALYPLHFCRQYKMLKSPSPIKWFHKVTVAFFALWFFAINIQWAMPSVITFILTGLIFFHHSFLLLKIVPRETTNSTDVSTAEIP